MANTYSITIVDKDTGLPRTGLTVKLRYSKDNFTTNAYDAVEVDDVASPGEYAAQNLVTAKYKTWVNGSEDASFGGTSGRPIISEEDLILLDAAAEYWDLKNKRAANINDPVNDKDAVNKQWSVAQYYNKTAVDNALAGKVGIAGTEIITGFKSFEIIPKIIGTDAAPIFPDPSEDGHVVHYRYFNARLATLNANPNPQSAQVVRVFGGATAVVGKLYPSIINAVSYCFTQTPSISKQFLVPIENMGPGIEIMIAASGSLKDYVHLIAAGQFIKIIIGDNSTLCLGSVENASIFLGAGVITTDRIFSGWTLKGCTVYNYRNLKLTDGQNERCTFISAPGYKVTLKDGCDVINSVFNEEPEFETHTGVRLYDSVSGVFTVPDDPTIAV